LPSTPTPGPHNPQLAVLAVSLLLRHVLRRVAFDRFKLALALAWMWPLQSAFDRYRWASSPASWVWMLPLSILAVSEPPGLNQAPGSPIHRIIRFRSCFVVGRVWLGFPPLSWGPTQSVSSSRIPVRC